jgi:hypothetical protein
MRLRLGWLRREKEDKQCSAKNSRREIAMLAELAVSKIKEEVKREQEDVKMVDGKN